MFKPLSSPILSFAIFSFLILAIYPLVAFSADTLKLYAVNYPPYDISDHPSGKRGFDVEVVEAAFAAEGVQVVVGFLPWKRIMKEVELGTATGAVTCSDVPDRRSWTVLSERISITRLAIVVHREFAGKNLETVHDLKSVNPVAIRGYSSQKELVELGIKHSKADTIKSALKMLAFRDNIQAFYGGWESTQFVAAEMGFREQFRFLPDTSKTPHPFYLCFSKKWPGVDALVQQFNKGLKTIQQKGIYQSIHSRYE